MNTAYIYSTTRMNTLGTQLLSMTDIERLLVAAPGEDMQSALKETYLAPYVLQAPDEDVAEAIELTMYEAKKLLHRIAPSGDALRVLWIQYDIHNLRVFAKAIRTGLSYDEIASYTLTRGIYEREVIYRHATEGLLDRLQMGWQAAYDEAVRLVETGSLDMVDGVFDQLLFSDLKRIAQQHQDRFIMRYVQAVIDCHNLRSRLRQLRLAEVAMSPVFISGGSFGVTEVETKEQVLAAFETLSPNFFTDAIATYDAVGNTSQLDAAIDDYVVTITRHASVDMFSSASLVLYYLRVRQAATNIRTIVVGRNSGMSPELIRTNLRTAYVNS